MPIQQNDSTLKRIFVQMLGGFQIEVDTEQYSQFDQRFDISIKSMQKLEGHIKKRLGEKILGLASVCMKTVEYGS